MSLRLYTGTLRTSLYSASRRLMLVAPKRVTHCRLLGFCYRTDVKMRSVNYIRTDELLRRSFSNVAVMSDKIEGMVKNSKVVVFMKGIPDQPMCGFSNAVVQVLRMHGVEEYDAHNVLDDDDLRQGVKDFSDWPTIPQVYFNGEFVGGCDIMLQMHQSGELIEELKKIGIESTISKE